MSCACYRIGGSGIAVWTLQPALFRATDSHLRLFERYYVCKRKLFWCVYALFGLLQRRVKYPREVLVGLPLCWRRHFWALVVRDHKFGEPEISRKFAWGWHIIMRPQSKLGGVIGCCSGWLVLNLCLILPMSCAILRYSVAGRLVVEMISWRNSSMGAS